MERSLKQIIGEAKVIAVVGCSASKYRTSHHIASYLQEQGYRVIPVNPGHEEILGEPCYERLAEIPRDLKIDIVDIFRNPRYTAEMIDTVIERVKLIGHKPVVWTQPGVSSGEAKEKAEKSGLRYIEDRCLMVDHTNLVLNG